MNPSKRYNMAWTAGFNAGLKVAGELEERKLHPEDVQARAQVLLEADADELVTLWNLAVEFETEKKEEKMKKCNCSGAFGYGKHAVCGGYKIPPNPNAWFSGSFGERVIQFICYAVAVAIVVSIFLSLSQAFTAA